MTTLNTDQAIQAMTEGLGAWQQGNRMVLMRHGRWYYLTLSMDQTSILAVNFMSSELASDTVTQMQPEASLIRFADISASLGAELAEKVLSDAESYRFMLANGRCRLIIGHTTDTLQSTESTIDSQIDTIQHLMNSGRHGPYLSFR